MIHKISLKLAQELLKRTGIVDYSLDVYIYGIELIISTTAEVFAILFLSLVLWSFWEGVAFIVCFFTLRIFSGGYHAGTYRNCFLVTTGTFLTIELMTGILMGLDYGDIVYGVLILAGVYVILCAPAPHKNHPLSRERMVRNRKIASTITLLQIAVANGLYVYYQRLFYIVSLTMFSTASLMLIVNIENAKKDQLLKSSK